MTACQVGVGTLSVPILGPEVRLSYSSSFVRASFCSRTNPQQNPSDSYAHSLLWMRTHCTWQIVLLLL